MRVPTLPALPALPALFIAPVLATLLALPLAAQAGRPAPAPASATRSADEREVLQVVQRVFDAMRTHDTTLLLAQFDSTARLYSIRMRNGTPTMQATPIARFAAAVGSAKDEWHERTFAPEVRIDETLAAVWTQYDFHLAGKFSHCGVDAFHLLKTATGWKIVSLADTSRMEGCPQRASP